MVTKETRQAGSFHRLNGLENANPAACPLAKALDVVVLVWSVDRVARQDEADDDAFGAEHVAQLLDERDRSAGSPEDDGLAPLGFEASCRRAQKGAVLGQDHGGAAARAVEFDRASLGQPRTHMRTETLADFLRVLVGDKAEGEAGRGAAGKDGTLAWALIAAGDAVDIDSRTPSHRFERRISFLDDPAREIDLVEKPGLLRQAAPLLAQALRDLAHVVIEAVDRHPPFLVVERSEERRVGKECRSRWSRVR